MKITSYAAAEDVLAAMIAEYKREAYINPEKQSDADALGLLVARWAEGDGDKIVRVFLSALEDANCHTLCAEVLELWKQAEEANNA